jgi:hypothetical protein
MKTKVVLYSIQARADNGAWCCPDDRLEPTPAKARAEIAIRKAAGQTSPMRWRRVRFYCTDNPKVSGNICPRMAKAWGMLK